MHDNDAAGNISLIDLNVLDDVAGKMYQTLPLFSLPLTTFPPVPASMASIAASSSTGLPASSSVTADSSSSNVAVSMLIIPPARDLHSFTFQLNLSALYEIGGARRGWVARVKGC